MKCTRAPGSDALWCKRFVAARDGFSGDLLHTGVIVLTSSTSEWPITSVLGLQREEIMIDCGFRRKKKVLQWQTVVFVGKKSYTVVVMPRP